MKTGHSRPFHPILSPEPIRTSRLQESIQTSRSHGGTSESCFGSVSSGGGAPTPQVRRRQTGGFESKAAAVHSGSSLLTGKFPVAPLLSRVLGFLLPSLCQCKALRSRRSHSPPLDRRARAHAGLV